MFPMVRLLYPLSERLSLTAEVSDGGLPCVDSLRQEGGTIYLQQAPAAGGLGLAIALTPTVQLTAGSHFPYFFQREISQEDDNRFKLFDHSLQVGFRFRL